MLDYDSFGAFFTKKLRNIDSLSFVIPGPNNTTSILYSLKASVLRYQLTHQ
jgi:hypothetical protein